MGFAAGVGRMVAPSNPMLFELFRDIEPACAVCLTSVYLVFDLGRDRNQVLEATDFIDAVDKFYQLGRQWPIKKCRVVGFYSGKAVTLCRLSPELLRKGNRLCGSN